MTTRIMLTFETDNDLDIIRRDTCKMVEDILDENGEVKETGVYTPDELCITIDENKFEFRAEAYNDAQEVFEWHCDDQLDTDFIKKIIDQCGKSNDFAHKLVYLAKQQGIIIDDVGEDEVLEEIDEDCYEDDYDEWVDDE